MPLSPHAIADRRIPFAFPFAGDTVHGDYFGAAVDALTQDTVQEWLAAGRDLPDEDAAKRYFAEFFLRYIARWDLVAYTNADGTPGPALPLDIEHVAPLDSTFLARMLVEAMSHAKQAKTSGAS